jgi:hypothetical protein
MTQAIVVLVDTEQTLLYKYVLVIAQILLSWFLSHYEVIGVGWVGGIVFFREPCYYLYGSSKWVSSGQKGNGLGEWTQEGDGLHMKGQTIINSSFCYISSLFYISFPLPYIVFCFRMYRNSIRICCLLAVPTVRTKLYCSAVWAKPYYWHFDNRTD